MLYFKPICCIFITFPTFFDYCIANVRMKSNKYAGIPEEYYGDIVPGEYNSRTKKWHVSYKDSDVESEDLNINDVLCSLCEI